MSIYHKEITEFIIKTHCILWDKEEGLSVNKDICCYADSTRLATEEEKERIFQAIKDNGYRWDSETKTLEKLVPTEFDINTLVSFESKVLIRNDKKRRWIPAFWGCKCEDGEYVTTYGRSLYCIPYEGNEHLLGTTDDCEDYYKSWE